MAWCVGFCECSLGVRGDRLPARRVRVSCRRPEVVVCVQWVMSAVICHHMQALLWSAREKLVDRWRLHHWQSRHGCPDTASNRCCHLARLCHSIWHQQQWVGFICQPIMKKAQIQCWLTVLYILLLSVIQFFPIISLNVVQVKITLAFAFSKMSYTADVSKVFMK